VCHLQHCKPVRLGAPKSNKPWLLQIEIRDLNTKRDVLRNGNSNWCNVYVSPDLTPKECQQSKELKARDLPMMLA